MKKAFRNGANGLTLPLCGSFALQVLCVTQPEVIENYRPGLGGIDR